MKKNLALISPGKDVYSETFIQNHKKHFDANIFFYYGDLLPMYLEGQGYLNLSLIKKIFIYLVAFIKKKPAQYIFRKEAVKKSFRKKKIDLVYAEYGPTGVALLDICRDLKLPLIVNFHGYDASMYDVLEMYKSDYKRLFEYASKVVAVSKAMYQSLLKAGCSEDRLVYIPYGPDDRFFLLEPTYSEKAFMAIGRFVDKKAPYYTILAFKQVVDRYPDARLYMIGDGPLLNSCINLVRYLQIEKNVFFEGVKKQQEMSGYFTKVKGFVQHSVTAINGDSEGTPVAVLEASAAALPVISTRHAGIPDVVIDGQTGFLVDEHDVNGMARNMILLLENDEMAKKMGELGRKNIMSNFSMDLHIQRLNGIIQESIT